jgi:tetratricopeptide (TPR) repeat protein
MKRSFLGGILALAAVMGLMAQAPPKQPTPKSQGELDAIKAMFSAQTPDDRIQAANNLITKYADTDFKGMALSIAAESYGQKNDYEKMLVFGEQALAADPKNFHMLLLMARAIANRTREFDLDREEKLARAEKYAKSADEELKAAQKPNPQLTDEQWTAIKKDYQSQGEEVLAMAAVARKNFDAAITHYKAAIDISPNPDPATMVRLGAAYDQAKRYDEAIAILDKVMAMPDVNPVVKQFAQAERVRAVQAKGGPAAAPAAGAAPAAAPQAAPAQPPAPTPAPKP